MPFKLGDTFLNKPAPTVPQHLWIILTHPQVDPNAVAVANVTSLNGEHGEDRSCVLSKGDHSFIKHASYIYYAKAKMTTVDVLESLLVSNAIKRRAPLDDDVLDRVLDGALCSPFCEERIKQLVRDQKW